MSRARARSGQKMLAAATCSARELSHSTAERAQMRRDSYPRKLTPLLLFCCCSLRFSCRLPVAGGASAARRRDGETRATRELAADTRIHERRSSHVLKRMSSRARRRRGRRREGATTPPGASENFMLMPGFRVVILVPYAPLSPVHSVNACPSFSRSTPKWL